MRAGMTTASGVWKGKALAFTLVLTMLCMISPITLNAAGPGSGGDAIIRGRIVITDDGSYIEVNGNGAPVGEWRMDENLNEWVFSNYPPAGNLPLTGESGNATLYLFFLIGLFAVGIAATLLIKALMPDNSEE